MYKNLGSIAVFFILILLVIFYFFLQQISAAFKNPKAVFQNPQIITSATLPTSTHTPTPSPTPYIEIKQPGKFVQIPTKKSVYQTFNNCGPAALSMLLDFYGINISQQTIADTLRPFQQIQGRGDDKSVTLDELAGYASGYGLIAYHRPGGDVNKLKLYLANGIPVLVVDWLDKDGGFGHYRIIKGFDEASQQIIEDDSIYGMNQKLSYGNFEKSWQVFNYQYLIIVPPEKKDLVLAILGEESNEQVAYQKALLKAQSEYSNNPQNAYPLFNQSINKYHLGNFDQSIQYFEQAKSRLPFRLIWYQIEPIESYLKLKKYNEVFALTNSIFRSGNPAASELYLLRGQAYQEQGKLDLAKKEFEKALYYNNNSDAAKQALESYSR